MFESHLKPPISFPSVSGSICTFNSQYAGLPLKSHTVDIDSVSGVSSINIGATGLNLIGLNTRASGIDLGITSEIQADNRIIASGRSTGNADISFTLANNVLLKGGQAYTFSLNGTDTRSNTLYFYIHVVGDGYSNHSIPSNAHSVTFTTSRDVFIDSCLLRTFNGGTVDIDAKAQLEIGSTAHSFESYSGNAYTINIGQTVNEATYNARTGVMEVTQPSVQTLQLPPCPIDTLEGVNNIWADTGDTTLQYTKFG